MADKRLGVYSRTFSPEFEATVIDQGNGFGRVVSRIASLFAAPTVYPVGPDISYWQGIIDWDVMASKAKFVIIRAGIGNSSIDARLEYNVSNAAALGIPYGLYWYVRPAHDAKKHADNFAAVVQTYGGTLPPTFDLEETGGRTKNDLHNWYAKMYSRFAEVSGLEYPQMMTYTSAGFLNNAIPLTNFLKWTKLWVATWGAKPVIPNEWAVSGKTWTYWQYTNKGNGAEYGAQSKSIDLNRKNEQIPGEDMRYKVVKLVNKRKDHNVNSEFLGQREVGEIVTPVETWGDVKYPGAYWALGQDGAWSVVQYYNPTVVYMQAFV